MTTPTEPSGLPPRRRFGARALVAAAAVAAVTAVAIAPLLPQRFRHKQEALNPFYRVVALNDTVDDPSIWGKNFPLQYDAYRRTVDQQRTKYGGSEALPRTPTQADPRSVVAQSRLEEDPRLKTFWAGHAFAADFREERGHADMLEHQPRVSSRAAAEGREDRTRYWEGHVFRQS
jgi:nitrite reductase (cytochrome c-552)